MADPRDDRVSAAYRDLPGEGPSPSLDAAIQAAARRAVRSRPAAGRRWQKPLSIAAVFMLAIAVSLQVEREKPIGVDEGAPASTGSAEYPVPQADTGPAAPASKPAEPAPAAKRAATPAPAPRKIEATREAITQPVPAPETKRFVPDAPAPASPPAADAAPSQEAPASPAPRREPLPSSAPPSAPAPAAAPPTATFSAPAASDAAASRDVMRAAPQAVPRAKSELAREATTQEKRMADALDTPERRLERIAGLRLRGLHDEADRELAEFRRAFPDYRISEEWLGKVQRK